MLVVILKVFLFFLLALLLLFLVLCLCKISLCVAYNGKTEVYAKLGFVKINLLKLFKDRSKKPKKRSLYKDLKLSESKNTTGTAKKKLTKKTAQEPIQDKNGVGFAASIIFQIVKKFFSYLKIKICRINVVVATEDAAKTAMVYSAVNSAMGLVYGALKNIKNFKICDKQYHVSADYLGSVSRYDIEIVFSVFVFQGLLCAIKGISLHLED